MVELTGREQLEQLFASMAAHLQGDAKFRQKAAQADVSLGFLVSDLDGDVALRFQRGDISAMPGGSGAARVALRMNAATLSKVLSGQQDPESAYMYGAISLARGDEYEAEGLLRFWQDIVAAYKAVAAA